MMLVYVDLIPSLLRAPTTYRQYIRMLLWNNRRAYIQSRRYANFADNFSLCESKGPSNGSVTQKGTASWDATMERMYSSTLAPSPLMATRAWKTATRLNSRLLRERKGRRRLTSLRSLLDRNQRVPSRRPNLQHARGNPSWELAPISSRHCCRLQGGTTVRQVNLDSPVLTRAIEKLARAGEQAGFSVEDLIRILNAGVSVERLVQLIDKNLQARELAGCAPNPDDGATRAELLQ